ncbi:hypothetical protein [Flavobacterium pedocola]
MSEQTSQSQVAAAQTVPSQATFSLVLSHLYKGVKPVIANANCVFSYSWNFEKNMGLAQLVSIDNCELNITLHPMGIQGYLDFMSDMPPTSVVINGQRVVLNRIILNVELATNKRSGGIMFNENGDTIQTTDNFNTAKAAF